MVSGGEINLTALKRAIAAGVPTRELALAPEVRGAMASLEREFLSPEELALFKGLTGPGMQRRLGNSLLTNASARELASRKGKLANERYGFFLAAVSNTDPRLAAQGLLEPFNAAYEDAANKGLIARS